MAEDVPASEFVPITLLQSPLEMIVRFIASEWAKSRPVDLAANDFKVLDEERLSAWMPRKPILQDLGEERGQRHVPMGPQPLAAFFFAKKDLLPREVDVVDEQAHHFASAGARVSREAKHRINERLQRLMLNVC